MIGLSLDEKEICEPHVKDVDYSFKQKKEEILGLEMRAFECADYSWISCTYLCTIGLSCPDHFVKK